MKTDQRKGLKIVNTKCFDIALGNEASSKTGKERPQREQRWRKNQLSTTNKDKPHWQLQEMSGTSCRQQKRLHISSKRSIEVALVVGEGRGSSRSCCQVQGKQQMWSMRVLDVADMVDDGCEGGELQRRMILRFG